MRLDEARVLILGGGGFIGSNVTRVLASQGAQVICFDHKVPEKTEKGVQYVEGDFFDSEQVRKVLIQADAVVHAISTITPSSSRYRYMEGYERDFMATLQMLDEAAARGVRVEFLSSGGTIYGEALQERIPEETALNPINHYGCVKACIEHVMRQFRRDGADFRIARIGNAYGPGQNYLGGVGFIDAAIKCALEGSPVQIWGDGENVRDYIYIEDICTLLSSILAFEGPEFLFNVGTGVGTSQNKVIKIIREWIPDAEVQYCAARAVDVHRNVLDTTVCTRVFGFKPRTLRQGIGEYIEFLRAQPKNRNL